MAVKKVLLLGNPKLWETCKEVSQNELASLKPVIRNLRDTLLDFRVRYNAGRAIAAPQIGVMKRIVYMHIDVPVIFINPVLDKKSKKMIELWDDCMSFPDLFVKVQRHYSCRITYRDMEWNINSHLLEGDLSELLQHECDHLDGVLAVQRAINPSSFALRSQRKFLKTHE